MPKFIVLCAVISGLVLVVPGLREFFARLDMVGAVGESGGSGGLGNGLVAQLGDAVIITAERPVSKQSCIKRSFLF
jgi:hypothetical protein